MYITQFSSETFTIISSGYGGKADLEGDGGDGEGQRVDPFCVFWTVTKGYKV
jgi:hypothetical protein